MKKETGGFVAIDNLVADAAGNVYFLDNLPQKVLRGRPNRAN